MENPQVLTTTPCVYDILNGASQIGEAANNIIEDEEKIYSGIEKILMAMVIEKRTEEITIEATAVREAEEAGLGLEEVNLLLAQAIDQEQNTTTFEDIQDLHSRIVLTAMKFPVRKYDLSKKERMVMRKKELFRQEQQEQAIDEFLRLQEEESKGLQQSERTAAAEESKD